MKISIIVPLYNEEKYITQCINSVLNQGYENIEIIVVDDRSTDNSLNLVKKVKDERIKIIELKENKGVANARNKGIEASTGDYICFLDSDDFWDKEKLKKQLEFINDKDFIYSGYMFTDKDGNNLKRVNVPTTLTYKDALKNTCIRTSTVMFKMKKINKKDLYMPNLKIGEDTYVWWNVLKKGIIAYGMDEVLAYYRKTGHSLSSNKVKAVLCAWKLYGTQNLKFYQRIYYFLNYLKNAIKKRIG